MGVQLMRYCAIALVLSLAAISPGGLADALADDNVVQGPQVPGTPPTDQMRGAARSDAAGSAGSAAARPLDLSLPPEALHPVEPHGHAAPALYRGLPGLQNVQDRNDPISTMRRALPGLLDPGNDDNPIRIKGRLLREPTEDPSPGAVDGGQIIIELKTE